MERERDRLWIEVDRLRERVHHVESVCAGLRLLWDARDEQHTRRWTAAQKVGVTLAGAPGFVLGVVQLWHALHGR